MAVAVSAPVVAHETTAQVRAAGWTAISAAIALVATVPLVAMLAKPISQLVFVRQSEYYNDWGRAFAITLIIVAPATYALFFGTAGELLKTRVTAAVHKRTMRFAAAGMVPYVVLTIVAAYWTSGPQESLMVTAGLSIPIAIAGTIWAATTK